MSQLGMNRIDVASAVSEKINCAESGGRVSRPLLRPLGFAVAVGVAVFIAGFSIDKVMLQGGRQILYSDLLTAGVVAMLAFALARIYAGRRHDELRQLQISAEVNHHVRNALTAILYSVQIHNDPELVAITRTAVARVDWVLREVYPVEVSNIKPPGREA
jgi:hypothetical protein